VDNGYDLANAPLLLLQQFCIHIGRLSFFRVVHNDPKIYGCQQHFDFEPPKVEVLAIKFVNDFNHSNYHLLAHNQESSSIHCILQDPTNIQKMDTNTDCEV
jgi:hypothetical protein